MHTRTLTALALVASAFGALAVTAQADDGDLTGAAFTEAEIAQIVTNAGYTFEEAEMEDGQIEAEGLKDGEEWELTIDARSGEIIAAERDD